VAVRLSDVRRDPIANRALEELERRYTVAEGKGGLVLTQRTGNMKFFVHELDDLHQWDFIWNLRLREFLLAIDEQRETWKRRAMEAERKLAEAADNVPSAPGRNVSDVRYGRLGATSQSSSILITPPDTASKRLFETRFSRKYGVK
jgi:hypothetical protein